MFCKNSLRKMISDHYYDNIDPIDGGRMLSYKDDRLNFAKEFGTFKFDPGRQQGKTEFIVQNIREGEYAFFHNDRTKEDFLRRLKLKYDTGFGDWIPPKENFFSFYEIERLDKEPSMPTRVWVDESKFLFSEQIEGLYSLFCFHEPLLTQFVFLG